MIEEGRRSFREAPAEFVVANGHVLFAAEAGDTGEELWALPLDALAELCVENCPDLATPVPTQTAAPTPTPTCGGDCTTLQVAHVSAAPGERVAVPVTLESRGEPVAGILIDLAFTPQARIAATARGHADCRVDPTIGKDASAFVFQPIGCDPARTCTAVRGLIISLLDTDPIADGATLFTCQVAISAHARPGDYPLNVPLRRRLVAGGPAGALRRS